MRTKVSKLLLTLIWSSLFFNSHGALAHGEDKPGPHGGFIRMPGAFHTEVLPQGKNKLKIYLLDINWKAPSVSQSSLEVTLEESNLKNKAQCHTKDDYYLCSFQNMVDLTKKGNLKVLAQRENQKGAEVSYELPFKLKIIDDGHGGHH